MCLQYFLSFMQNNFVRYITIFLTSIDIFNIRSANWLISMAGKFLIVEFSDGLQIIPTKWMNTIKKTAIWPSHLKTERRLHVAIVSEEMPKEQCDWEEFPIKRIFGSAGNIVKKNFMCMYICAYMLCMCVYIYFIYYSYM